MRRRSARRSLALDVVEVMMAAGLVLGGVILLVGETIVTSPVAWFAVPCLVTANGAVTGLVWASILYRRMPPGDRVLEGLGITLGVLALIDCALQLGQALNGFVWPPGPLLAVHALTMGMLVLLPLHVSRLPSTGLDRTSAGQQVRGSRALTVALLGALPVLLVETLVMSRRVSWAGMWFAGLLLLLVVLTALRNLLALEETRRLYAEVTEAAEERKVLLADVMRTVDGERRQAATQVPPGGGVVLGVLVVRGRQRRARRRRPRRLGADPRRAERVAEALGDLVEVVRPPADEPWASGSPPSCGRPGAHARGRPPPRGRGRRRRRDRSGLDDRDARRATAADGGERGAGDGRQPSAGPALGGGRRARGRRAGRRGGHGWRPRGADRSAGGVGAGDDAGHRRPRRGHAGGAPPARPRRHHRGPPRAAGHPTGPAVAAGGAAPGRRPLTT